MKIFLRTPQAFSEIGRKENQEDALFPKPADATAEQRFFILCDGMGGHAHGEVASNTVSQAMGEYLEKHAPKQGEAFSQGEFAQALAAAYHALDQHDDGGTRRDRMGTTLTCLILHGGGYLAAHIGDSRIYHIRPSIYNKESGRGGIVYQSADHSLVNRLLAVGELTPEEAKNYPHKNIITRVMQPGAEGHDKADVCVFPDVKAGDYFFLCCDGVLERLTNQRLCEILATDGLNDEERMKLIKAECDGQTRDNYTAWLIPVDKVEGEPLPIAADEDETTNSILRPVEVEKKEAVQVELAEEIEKAEEEADFSPSQERKRLPLTAIIGTAIVVLALALAALFFLKPSTGKSPHGIQKVESPRK